MACGGGWWALCGMGFTLPFWALPTLQGKLHPKTQNLVCYVFRLEVLWARKKAVGLQYAFIVAFPPNFHIQPRKPPVLSLRCNVLCDNMLRFSALCLKRQSFLICLYGTNMPLLTAKRGFGREKMCENTTICIIVSFVPTKIISETENAQNTSGFSGKQGLQVTLGWPIYIFVNPDAVFQNPGTPLTPRQSML